MSAKPVNPYSRLMDEFKAFLSSIRFPTRKAMVWWEKDSCKNMDGRIVYERTLAAQQLGMRVEVKADEKGLHFWYVSLPKEEELPWSLR